MNNCICKINFENKQAIGFFCKIPIPYNNMPLYVLITNNNVLNEDILDKKDGKISINIKDEKNIKELNLNNRKKYTSEIYNTTIIEIKEEDEIKCYYLELEQKLKAYIINNDKEIKNNYFDKYIGEIMYMINNPFGILTISHIKIINIEKIFFYSKSNSVEASL